MKTTERFDNAVSKLYTAYWDGTLNAFDCAMCAVGSILETEQEWLMHTADDFKEGIEPELQKGCGLWNPPICKDYSTDELIQIEYVFLLEFSKDRETDGTNKNSQFKGLCAVVEYLCELDNIPNVMDYTKLFETENNEPKFQLS